MLFFTKGKEKIYHKHKSRQFKELAEALGRNPVAAGSWVLFFIDSTKIYTM